MKHTIIAVTLTVSAFATASPQQQITEKVTSWMSVDVQPISSLAIRTAFQCQFFAATPMIKEPQGEMHFGGYLFYSLDNSAHMLEQPSTTQALPDISRCLKTDFNLAEQENVLVFAEAMKSLYESNGSSFAEQFETKIEKSESGWTIITGTFFEDYSGYLIDLSNPQDGATISYSLDLPR